MSIDSQPLSKQIRKHVTGKKIAQIRLNRFSTGVKDKPFTFDPVIILEDDTRIFFVVNETEGGEYGIEPVIITP